jgi:hypothetical protein
MPNLSKLNPEEQTELLKLLEHDQLRLKGKHNGTIRN